MWIPLENDMAKIDSYEKYRASPDLSLEFFQKIMPFRELSKDELEYIAGSCSLDFFPKGTRILTADESQIEDLHLILKGAVSTFIADEHGETALESLRGEGEYFGALGILQNSRANLHVETVEDTFCLLLPKQVFLDLIAEKPLFSQYYLKSFSNHFAKTTYNELRNRKLKRRSSDDLLLFSNKVGDLVQKNPIIIKETTTIQEAALLMAEQRVGSLLVHHQENNENLTGIVTDRDLRFKVVAAGKNTQDPVRDIMSSPLITVLSQTLCFDALITMLSKSIHHIPVERKGKVIGIITTDDIVALQGTSPHYLFKEIASQTQIAGLYPLAQKIPDIIRNLLKEGGKSSHITSMIAIINDQILERMLHLLSREMGPSPLPFCWLLMGSEGRREQTFKTDQDNALIYADPKTTEEKEAAELYFAEFSEKAINHLINCGFPPCPGKIMANNPQWCQPYSTWQKYFDTWVLSPDPEEVIKATIFFDFRAGYGHTQLALDLRNHLIAMVDRKDIFLFHLARQALTNKAPLSLFRNFIVEKDGEHRNRLDIKHKGIAPISDFARILALKHGIKETNTLSRLRVLADEEYLERPLFKLLHDSYEMMMQQRLMHQLQEIEQGKLPDNHVNPEGLSDIERRMLKESFRVLERMHSVLETMYSAP